jgi:hypothetical protein
MSGPPRLGEAVAALLLDKEYASLFLMIVEKHKSLLTALPKYALRG